MIKRKVKNKMKKQITKDPLELLGYTKINKLNSATPRIEYRRVIDYLGRSTLQIFFDLSCKRVFINAVVTLEELDAIYKIRKELWNDE